MSEVKVSGDAHKALAQMVRQWSGWRKGTLVLGEPKPEVSPFAMTDFSTKTFTVNPDPLVLNPHRVLNSVTPFRLRQEAILTGVLLHEAGHARHSLWLPRNEAERGKFKHTDGTDPTPQTVSFARCMEEARIEGLMARDSRANGSLGLEWTMRAAAAKLLPMTNVSDDPAQAVLDVIQSYVLRGGRQVAINHWTDYQYPAWVNQFANFLNSVLVEHFTNTSGHTKDPYNSARLVFDFLNEMIKSDDGTGPTLIDVSRETLRLLFPETDDEDMPDMGGSCSGGGGGDAQDEPQTGEQEAAGGSGQGAPTEPGDGDTDSDTGQENALSTQALQLLAEMEAKAETETAEEATAESKSAPPQGGITGGSSNGQHSGGWRNPTKAERDTAKNAERFLRGLVDPSESAKVALSDSPTSNIDGAAMSAWKASGMRGDPMFFRRTNRTVEPAPPVKIAVLVDVSSSMEDLQEPSALLSWALASAAFDMRNFAGRGRQIESCLIHWGDSAEVIQRNGEQLPGIREVRCNQGTKAMDQALGLVEEQMPGFFTDTIEPENRLIVQFTDWEIWGGQVNATALMIRNALSIGVNMLTVAPNYWSRQGQGCFSRMLDGLSNPRGKVSVMSYDEHHPEQVWTHASQMLKG